MPADYFLQICSLYKHRYINWVEISKHRHPSYQIQLGYHCLDCFVVNWRYYLEVRWNPYMLRILLSCFAITRFLKERIRVKYAMNLKTLAEARLNWAHSCLTNSMNPWNNLAISKNLHIRHIRHYCELCRNTNYVQLIIMNYRILILTRYINQLRERCQI